MPSDCCSWEVRCQGTRAEATALVQVSNGVGRGVQAEEAASAKVLGQDRASRVGGAVRRPVRLEQSEGGGEREDVRAGRGQGQEVQGLVDIREDLGFYPQGGGSPGGLWAEEGWDWLRFATDGCEHLAPLWLCDLGQVPPFSSS